MKVILPDNSEKEVAPSATPADVAAMIGEGLAKAAIGAKIDGELVDVHRPLSAVATGERCHVALVTGPRINKKGKANWRDGQPDADALYLLRHSAAHVMAEAITRLWPDAQLAYGPPLDNGFYYDIKLDTPISSDDFPKIEAEMKKIIEEDRPFTRYELELKDGFEKLKAEQNKYKVDNAERAQQAGAKFLSWYVTGFPKRVDEHAPTGTRELYELDYGVYVPIENTREGFIPTDMYVLPEHSMNGRSYGNWEDLCQGPHLPRTGLIGAFKVTSVARSNWKGDITLDPFQRVYGTAFFTQDELDEHLSQLEEAKARDHRVVGQRHQLFTISDKVGQGLILWKPNGAVIRQELQNFIGQHLERQGYSQVFTPHIGKLDLFKTSGHFPYYQDSQYPPLVERETLSEMATEGCTCGDLANRMNDGDIDGYLLKPMNCPFHIQVYASEKHSYRDLPIRLAEFGTVYRWEQSGELNGMTRVRGFTQDDAHLFVTPEQLADEVLGCIELVKIVFKTLGMDDYRVRVGLRDPDDSKFSGEASDWDAAEKACLDAAKSLGVPFSEEPGEAAFYGPKIDFVVRDVIGREWQLGTVQVDYQLPQRFDLSYIGADNQAHRPIMIHRAPFGSMERFVGVLIEHFNGSFPLWLSPQQVRVLPISDKFADYAESVAQQLKAKHLRVTVDTGNDRINAKIKLAQEEKIPYMLVVGGKDEQAGTVSVRHRTQGDRGAIPTAQFIEEVCAERDEKRL